MTHKAQSTGANKFGVFKQGKSPCYFVRIMFKGKRRKFSTQRTRKSEAEDKARAIMADLRSRGWEETISIHGLRKDSIPTNPTIDEFCKLYEELSTGFDKDLRKATTARYTRELRRICTRQKVSKIGSLDKSKIESFKLKYLNDAQKDQRDSDKAKRSLNGILRNAGSLFSKQALEGFQKRGLIIDNPFLGTKTKGIKLKAYSPLAREILNKIWEDAPKLRDGYPKKAEKVDNEFKHANLSAYLILLLELGLGLRRNEADKAEWTWISENREGNPVCEIRETSCFRPKSGRNRTVPIQTELYQALKEYQKDEDRFIIPSDCDTPDADLKNPTYYKYRCDNDHRVLVKWLKWKGVDDPKPCHRLRKEFGSNVATSLSLFYAQKYLGHSSPQVTSDYYAALTDLPAVQSFTPQS